MKDMARGDAFRTHTLVRDAALDTAASTGDGQGVVVDGGDGIDGVGEVDSVQGLHGDRAWYRAKTSRESGRAEAWREASSSGRDGAAGTAAEKR